MLKLRDISALNVESSSKCTASCAFCSRQQKIKPYGEHVLLLKDFKLLPREMIQGLKRVTFAGNFGDFSTNHDMVAIADYLKCLNGNIVLGGDTNGMAQSEDWWQELGTHFADGAIAFAVDGLEDTHARHRVGTDYNNVLRNIHAFARGGGMAYWKFIVFAHNEHQVEAAESRARDIGCKGFTAISSRNYNSDLRIPKSFQFDIKRNVFSHYLDMSPFALCNPIHKGSLYLAADGTVHPCCFAHSMYICGHNHEFRFIVPLIEKFRREINFKTRPLESILTGPYFKAVLEQSRNNAYCRMKCNSHKKEIRRQLVLHEKLF